MTSAILHPVPSLVQQVRSESTARADSTANPVAASRRAVGLPDHVEDPVVLARVAAILATVHAARQISDPN